MQMSRRYERLENIGQWSFGKVYNVLDRKSKNYFVLKEIDLSVLTPKNIREAENEVKILNILDHENLISIIDSYKFQSKHKNLNTDFALFFPRKRFFVVGPIESSIFVLIARQVTYNHLTVRAG